MEGKRIAALEICIGLFLVVIGVILWWWSGQLLWILIYPPPSAKRLLDILPFAFWGLGVLLIIDGVRRNLKRRKTE